MINKGVSFACAVLCFVGALSGIMCLPSCSGDKTERIEVAIKDVTGFYTGRYMNIFESVELNDDTSFVHKVFFDNSCVLVETNTYAIHDGAVECRGFTVFVSFLDLSLQACPTNGQKYEYMKLHLFLSGEGKIGGFFPWPGYNFHYLRETNSHMKE